MDAAPLAPQRNLPPSATELAVITHAPEVPPPIARRHPARVVVELDTTSELLPVSSAQKYEMWTFNGSVPGPFVRARVGDVLEVRYTNRDKNGIAHNIDFHAVTGPGGGAPALYAEENQTRIGSFALLHPGLFVYHCAAEPVATHIANGMYGLLLVEPEEVRPFARQGGPEGKVGRKARLSSDPPYVLPLRALHPLPVPRPAPRPTTRSAP